MGQHRMPPNVPPAWVIAAEMRQHADAQQHPMLWCPDFNGVCMRPEQRDERHVPNWDEVTDVI